MTSKTLTAPSGDRLTVQPDLAPSESVFLCADDADYSVTAGPFDSADLIAAIREAAREADESAEDSISRAELDARLARRDEAHKRQVARMQRHIETLQRLLALRRKRMDEMREQMEAMPPAPSTPREALALAVDLAYEVGGDTMPDQPGYMIVGEEGMIHVYPDGSPVGLPARDKTCRRLLLDTPAPVTPAWHNARIVRATLDDVTCEWAQETSTLWRSLDGHGYIATADALSDVTVVVPGEVEA